MSKKYNLFNTELTEIKNGWLVTERLILFLGVSHTIVTYFPTLEKALVYLAKRDKAAKKQAEKEKKRKKAKK